LVVLDDVFTTLRFIQSFQSLRLFFRLVEMNLRSSASEMRTARPNRLTLSLPSQIQRRTDRSDTFSASATSRTAKNFSLFRRLSIFALVLTLLVAIGWDAARCCAKTQKACEPAQEPVEMRRLIF
jgi:hypothetical protein